MPLRRTIDIALKKELESPSPCAPSIRSFIADGWEAMHPSNGPEGVGLQPQAPPPIHPRIAPNTHLKALQTP